MGACASNANNSELLAKYGGIYIKPEKDSYHPGEQFNGVVYLNLLTNCPGDSLIIEVKCKEKYMFV